jgi:single-strand DNA-binding protein
MAGSVNKVILIGNLGKDPEVKSFENGGKIANFSLATTESWKDQQTGERKSLTDWHNISIRKAGLVGVAEQYLKKGMSIYVEGRLRTREYTTKEGEKRYTTEVIVDEFTMLGSRQDGANAQPMANGAAVAPSPQGGDTMMNDDDLPF